MPSAMALHPEALSRARAAPVDTHLGVVDVTDTWTEVGARAIRRAGRARVGRRGADRARLQCQPGSRSPRHAVACHGHRHPPRTHRLRRCRHQRRHADASHQRRVRLRRGRGAGDRCGGRPAGRRQPDRLRPGRCRANDRRSSRRLVRAGESRRRGSTSPGAASRRSRASDARYSITGMWRAPGVCSARRRRSAAQLELRDEHGHHHCRGAAANTATHIVAAIEIENAWWMVSRSAR